MSNRNYKIRFGKEIPYTELTDTIDRQLNRYTIRHFDNTPVEPELLELLIASAQCSATSGYLQNYSVIAIPKDEAYQILEYENNKSILGIGGKDSQNSIAFETCSFVLVWIADLYRTNLLVNQLPEVDPEVANQAHTAEYHLKAIVDTTIVAQSFAMSAESTGLGVMYWGALRQLPIELLEKNLNLPKLTFPLFGMLVGYPHRLSFDTYKTVRPRLDTSTVLHYSTYKKINNANDLGKYTERVKIRNAKDKDSQQDVDSLLVDRLHVTKFKKLISHSLSYMGFTFK